MGTTKSNSKIILAGNGYKKMSRKKFVSLMSEFAREGCAQYKFCDKCPLVKLDSDGEKSAHSCGFIDKIETHTGWDTEVACKLQAREVVKDMIGGKSE